MTACVFIRLYLYALLLVHSLTAQYVPPEALVEPLKPVGIRISIPDEQGISLVAFHVKFNDDFNGLEAGTIARDIVQRKDGRWTYEDRSTQLKKSDNVYYWIHVVYNGLGYNLINQRHRVIDFYDYKGQKIVSNDYGDGSSGLNQSCLPSVTKLFDSTGANRYPCAGQLLFQDDFKDFFQFERMQWTVVEQFPAEPDYEFVVYRDSRENLKVKNGLKISPELLSSEFNEAFVREGNLTLYKCTGREGTTDCFRSARGWNILPPVTSSRVNTKKSLNFEYGRVEIRAKFPHGDWIYPVLALEPVRYNDDSSLVSLQIRIASAAGNEELRTKNGRDISGHILWGGVTGLIPNLFEERVNDNTATRYNRDLWSNDFHTYEIIWSPDRIILRVDGQGFEDKQVYLPRDTPFYLTIGVAVGGLSEFPDNCTSRGYTKSWRNIEAKALYNFFDSINSWKKTWPTGSTSLNVEYVKIWAL